MKIVNNETMKMEKLKRKIQEMNADTFMNNFIKISKNVLLNCFRNRDKDFNTVEAMTATTKKIRRTFYVLSPKEEVYIMTYFKGRDVKITEVQVTVYGRSYEQRKKVGIFIESDEIVAKSISPAPNGAEVMEAECRIPLKDVYEILYPDTKFA